MIAGDDHVSQAIVLAAGFGSRFGGGKLLARWRGAPLLHAALRCASRAPVDRLIVVTGNDREAITRSAREFGSASGRPDRIVFAHAADHAEGMAASLRAGFAALPQSTRSCFIFLGDMPRIPPRIAPSLAEALRRQGAAAAVPQFDGRRGHPVLVAQPLFHRFATLAGDVGARSILDSLGTALAVVPADDCGVLFDVDTPEQLAEA